MGRSILRNSTYYYILALVVGSVLPDVGHGLSLITKGEISWNATHMWYVPMFGLLLALFLGYITGVVLKR